MTQFELLDQIIADNQGSIRIAQAKEAGVTKPVFYDYISDRNLERVGPGIYLSPDAWKDEMYIIHLRYSHAIFSHETALFFHDLTDREPLKYSVTLRTGYNSTKPQADGLHVYTVKKELHSIGLDNATTPFGHDVPVYNAERTICDILRSRSSIETFILQDAVKRYARSKEKNLSRLMQYAPLFHVEKLVRQYMEVLL